MALARPGRGFSDAVACALSAGQGEALRPFCRCGACGRDNLSGVALGNGYAGFYTLSLHASIVGVALAVAVVAVVLAVVINILAIAPFPAGTLTSWGMILLLPLPAAAAASHAEAVARSTINVLAEKCIFRYRY